MNGVTINAVAKLLQVGPNTLRSWEHRYDYPKPRRTSGGHRRYDLHELQALRRALIETGNISSAIEVARHGGQEPVSASHLVEAFSCFDEASANRVMEESLALRSVERSLDEVLFPALEMAHSSRRRDPGYEFGCRWATGWLHAAKRVAPPASRSEGVLILDTTRRLGLDSLHVQALELGVRRAAFPTLLLSIHVREEHLMRAVRALAPTACVFAGGEGTPEIIRRSSRTLVSTTSGIRIFAYRFWGSENGAIPRIEGGVTQAVVGLTTHLHRGDGAA